MPARYTEYQLLDDVQAALVNPKRHAGEVIEASIERHGYIESPVVDERTGRMVGGHGRVAALVALRERGEPPPDGIDVDDQGRWLVPVGRGWASENDLEAAAALVTLNRSTELGGWDTPELGTTLAQIADGPGLAGVGYTQAEVDAMLSGTADGAGTDPAAEWVGMPEFEQPNRESAFSTHIHFANADDAERFAVEVLGLGAAIRSTWWPESDGLVGSDQTQAYVAAGS